MKRDIVVYFGMGFLPEANAVACREQVFAKLVQHAGLTPVLIGIKRGLSFGEYETFRYNDICHYSVKYAGSFKEKIKDNFVIQKTLWRIIEEIGAERIKCFVMQDYQWLPMKQLRSMCQKEGIAFVADIMDWFTPTRDYSLPKNIFKSVDTYMRMYLFYPKLKNRLYISHKFQDFFADTKANAMVLPCTAKNTTFLPSENSEPGITLTFAGSPGPKFEKEKLDWIIRALYENGSSICLKVIGISEDDCLKNNEYLRPYITEKICFLGRIPHEQCLDVLRKSDFSLVVRQVNKLTTYGFSSKVCEAFANGIPVIATDTSDNALYIQNGYNGFICSPSYEALKEMLKEVEKISKSEITQMKKNIQQNNPLCMDAFYQEFVSFLDNLKLS